MRVGKLFYRMKMRKSLDEALKWFKQTVSMKTMTDPARMALTTEKVSTPKVIEIIVESASNLQIRG